MRPMKESQIVSRLVQEANHLLPDLLRTLPLLHWVSPIAA